MTAATLPGSVFVANLWWYAFSVLRPAQALKAAGVYRSPKIGEAPVVVERHGGGQAFCYDFPEPVLLSERPGDYHLVEDFDHLSSDYQWVVEPFSRPIFEEVMQAMAPYMTDDSRILDPSCGPGTEALLLAERVPFGEVVAADFSADMVKTAAAGAARRGLENMAFFQLDVAKMPAHFEGQFDAVYCSFAFHHYPDPLGALREMRRALRPGGHTFIVDAGPWWMKALASPLAKWGDPGWVAFHTGEEFERLFREAGFPGFHWVEVLPGIGLCIGTA
jgi:ubiquinone/menaquinone biosynthesis C-methylase UbiE